MPLNSKHPLAGVVTTWLSQLKFWPLMRILDVFMLEGPHIFHRAGLVLLESWYRSISMSSGSRGRESGPAWYLPSSSARAVENPDQFMKDCSKYRYDRIPAALLHHATPVCIASVASLRGVRCVPVHPLRIRRGHGGDECPDGRLVTMTPKPPSLPLVPCLAFALPARLFYIILYHC